jgi:AcrR family transcriptional regulator
MARPAKLEPQQARSRESEKRLLRAAVAVLDEAGLEGATIPRIARRAHLSPGAVYRRFRDKDALLRALLLETLRSSERHTEAMLTAEFVRQYSLPDLTGKIIASTLEGYRERARLIRALTQFARSHPSAAFRRQVDEIEVRNFRRVVKALLDKRSEIQHPDPDLAVPFALMLVALALREMVILDVLSETWSPLLPKDDSQLAKELTHVVLNYLGSPAQVRTK